MSKVTPQANLAATTHKSPVAFLKERAQHVVLRRQVPHGGFEGGPPAQVQGDPGRNDYRDAALTALRSSTRMVLCSVSAT